MGTVLFCVVYFGFLISVVGLALLFLGLVGMAFYRMIDWLSAPSIARETPEGKSQES